MKTPPIEEALLQLAAEFFNLACVAVTHLNLSTRRLKYKSECHCGRKQASASVNTYVNHAWNITSRENRERRSLHFESFENPERAIVKSSGLYFWAALLPGGGLGHSEMSAPLAQSSF